VMCKRSCGSADHLEALCCVKANLIFSLALDNSNVTS